MTWTASLACALLCLHGAHAAMQLDRTRLVFNEGDASAVVQARSADRAPILLQMWVEKDDGKSGAQAGAGGGEATHPPETGFIVDPPVMRLGPGRSRAMRVLRVKTPGSAPNPAPAPQPSTTPERETLYWLNVVEIPATVPVGAPDGANPTNDVGGSNRLTMRVKTRLKLFYRPRALVQYSKSAARRVERLRFSAGQDAAGHAWLTIENPAPIHQSLARLTLHPAGRATPLELATPMLAPFERLRLDVPPDFSPDFSPDGRTVLPATRLTFATINDNGNLMEGEQTLLPEYRP